MKIACALLPDFEVALERSRRPDLAERPIVLGGMPHERKTVIGCSPQAAAYGIVPGMSLRQAQGLCPDATFLPPDEELYRSSFARLLHLMDGFSPRVEGSYPPPAPTGRPPRPSAVYLDAEGLEMLLGPDEELGRRIVSAIAGTIGAESQVGISGSKFVAWMAALATQPGSARVVKGGEEAAFLAPLPVERLDCPPEILRRLQLLGIATMGQLAALPRGALAEQFGPEGDGIYRLARGIDPRPVVGREVPLQLEEGMEIDTPTGEEPFLRAAASRLIERLALRMKAEYLACREVELRLGLAPDFDVHIRTTLHEATDLPAELERAVGRLLSRIPNVLPVPPEGQNAPRAHAFTRLGIALSGFGGREEEQLGLFPTQAAGLKKVQRTIQRAEEQFGREAIRPLAAMAGEKPRPALIRVAADQDSRPVILFIDGKMERVREVCNRWRVMEDWWRREMIRDYYRVITDRGRLYLIFQDLSGIFPNRTPVSPQGNWFLERVYG